MIRILLAFLFICNSLSAEEINLFKDKKDLKHIDDTVGRFMRKYKVNGLSISLSRKGKIVLSKGFGLSSKEKRVPCTADTKFRIASISKPITSVAIMKLVEEKKLTLDAKVFGPGGILDFKTDNKFIQMVTVRHLLEHTAGKEWDNSGVDPMFQRHELSQKELIEWSLKEFPLKKTPGKNYNYSNFGYCLLGRVIEKVTSKSYEQYVKDLLAPAGIKSFQLGKKKPVASEAVYYTREKYSAYGFPVARMDAHGGWISTSADLVRLALAVDGTGKDILKKSTVKTMTTPSKTNANYALGWSVNRHNNWWHMGAMTGTSSVIVRTGNGMCWSVLINTRVSSGTFMRELDELTWNIVNKINKWP